MNRFCRLCTFIAMFLISVVGLNSPLYANKPAKQIADSCRSILLSQFTSSLILVDGIAETAWDKAKPTQIGIKMTTDLSAAATGCKTYGEVRSLWDGSLLYLLIDVTDADISTAGEKAPDKDGVEIYFDLWNDKYPKYEEDDGITCISSEGELTGSGVYADRLNSYAAAPMYNSEKIKTGYTIEMAINIGGVRMENGSSMGIDFCINDATTPDNKCKFRIFWSDGNNKGLDDNSRWGNVELTGYDGKSSKAIDTFLLLANIKKAGALPRGVWMDETNLNRALADAKNALISTTQTEINKYSFELDNAVKSLSRNGKYPDPFDLPEINYLPDPFTFQNGSKVESPEDWKLRKEEIKDLAQYYEYGYMPAPPESVTATMNGSSVVITVNDKNKIASFDARLTVPTVDQCGKPGPYPVIVSIDFWSMEPNKIFLEAGYAVLSVIYSSVAGDNYEHTGAFYTLFPYDVTTGNDAGTLLAWAWGASRGVDALMCLAKNDPAFANTFDMEKLVVTGFSRCGKAALAAGFFDDRFDIVNPGASGCGGAAVYRYVSFGNRPHRTEKFGNEYEWGTSPGCEVMGDKIRHQGHNSNEMLRRFLNPDRIYQTNTNGYGERLPYDHHEIIAAIAPRAVIITTANDDYANNAEGDCIGLEGAKPVFKFLGAEQNLALNIRTTGEPNPWGWGDGHWLSNDQMKNLIYFADFIFYSKPLPEKLITEFYSNPYIPTMNKYYGGIEEMMPWIDQMPNMNNEKEE